MLLVTTDIPQQDYNIFDCITTQKEIFIAPKELPIIDYLVSVYPRNENANPFPFVYGLFDRQTKAFAHNQDIIINIATSMFIGSVPLSEFEQNVLNITLKKSVKSKPTLAGRK